MNFWVKASLGFLLGAVFVGGYFLDEYFDKKQKKEQENSFSVFTEESDDVKKIVFHNREETFIFEKEQDKWFVVFNNVRYHADSELIPRLLRQLKGLKIQSVLHETPDLKMSEFGSRFDINKESSPSITLFSTMGKEEQLILGKSTGIGNTLREEDHEHDHGHGHDSHAASDSLYAYLSQRDQYIIVSAKVGNLFLNKELSHFRSKQVYPLNPAEVNEISVHMGANVVSLKKEALHWYISSREPILADEVNVDVFLRLLQTLKGQKLFDKDKELIEKTRHSKNYILLKNTAGEIVGQYFLVQENSIPYVSMDNVSQKSINAVASLPNIKWEELLPQEAYFRDKLVLRGIEMEHIKEMVLVPKHMTYIKEEQDWKEGPAQELFSYLEFMTASVVLDHPKQKEMKLFGLDKPIAVIALKSPLFHKTKGELKLELGSRVPGDETKIYLKRSDIDKVFVVEAKLLDWL